MLRTIALMGVLLAFSSIQTWAQRPHMEFGRFETGGGIGTTLYKGDIVEHFHGQFMKPAFQGIFRHNVSKTVTLRYNLMYGQITAQSQGANPDPYVSQVLDLSFSTPLIDLTAGIEYNFFDFRREPLRPWSPYLFLGVGGFYFNPSVQEPEGGVSSIQPAIPFGIGVKIAVYRNWNVGIEFLTRKTFTDFLDNTSDTDGNTPPMQRGNPQTMDWYSFTGINITYTFAEVICPKETGGFIY